MKHDMNKFNLTQSECRIQNLINLLANRKKLNVFLLLLCYSKDYKSITPLLNTILTYNIISESYIKVMRIKVMITKKRSS